MSYETFRCWLSWKTVMPRLSCGSLAFHSGLGKTGMSTHLKKGRKKEWIILCKCYKDQGNVQVWGTTSGLFFHYLPIFREKTSKVSLLTSWRCLVRKKLSILYGFYAFRNQQNLVSTDTTISAANGSSLIAVDIVSFNNSLKLIVYCFPTEGTMWRITYNLFIFILKPF